MSEDNGWDGECRTTAGKRPSPVYIVHVSEGPWPVDRTEWVELYPSRRKARAAAAKHNARDDRYANALTVKAGERAYIGG